MTYAFVNEYNVKSREEMDALMGASGFTRIGEIELFEDIVEDEISVSLGNPTRYMKAGGVMGISLTYDLEEIAVDFGEKHHVIQIVPVFDEAGEEVFGKMSVYGTTNPAKLVCAFGYPNDMRSAVGAVLKERKELCKAPGDYTACFFYPNWIFEKGIDGYEKGHSIIAVVAKDEDTLEEEVDALICGLSSLDFNGYTARELVADPVEAYARDPDVAKEGEVQ